MQVKLLEMIWETSPYAGKSRMCFWLRKSMRNKDAFVLREMRIILSELELLVMKDKLKVYKRLRERILPCLIKLAEIELFIKVLKIKLYYQ